jgi:alpha-glucosidase (family GH31 glycosyl hydrolase)
MEPLDALTGLQSTAFIQLWLPNVIRVTHATPGSTQRPLDPLWLKDVCLHLPETTDVPQITIERNESGVRLIYADGKIILDETQPVLHPRSNRNQLGWRMEPHETLFGFGEQFDSFRRTNSKLTLINRESPALLQSRQTYSAMPFFLSSRGYALWLLNAHPSHWTISNKKGLVKVDVTGGSLDYVVIFGNSPQEIITSFTEITGRPPLLPRWAFGLWLTEYPQSSQEKVVEMVSQHRQRDIPLDAIILDYHWEEKFHNFRWRSGLFPEPTAFLNDLSKHHVHLGLIFTPFVNHTNQWVKRLLLHFLVSNLSHGAATSDDRALEVYNQAERLGLLAHSNAEWWLGKGGMLDFTDPAAGEWWQIKLAPLYQQGVAFFKNDDGEYLPKDAKSHIGLSADEHHNMYGFYYGRAIYSGMGGMDDRRPMIYARSVGIGSQRYPAMFLGDQKPAAQYMHSTLKAALNLSLAGFAYWTADVFGLDGKTTPETHMRCAQWSLLNPIARYFIRPSEIDSTRFPWSHGAEVESNFRKYTNLRYQLLPYWQVLAWQAYQTGIPPVRPLFVNHPDDPICWEIDDAYMMGDCLLIAPVMKKGALQRDVYLPEGTWYDFWTDSTNIGNRWHTIQAPLDHLPIFVRGGTCLPMGPNRQYIGSNHRFDKLSLHFYPPFPVSFSFRDDDGTTRAYQRGCYSEFTVTCSKLKNNTILLSLSPEKGQFQDQPQVREITVILHQQPQNMIVETDIPYEPVPDPAHDTVAIKFDWDTATPVGILLHPSD